MVAIRVPVSTFGGALLSVALFLGLARLVSVPFDAEPPKEATRIDFRPQVVESTPVTKREPRVEREPPILEPGPPRIHLGDRGDPVERVRIEGPRIDTGARDRGVALSGMDTDVIPRIRVNPEYPPPAIARNLEGWVRVQFTVTAIGTVRDAVVVASEPRSTFDEAALKAIARWRYNPRVVNGEAVERVGLQTVIRFEIEN
jgi:protein TonB